MTDIVMSVLGAWVGAGWCWWRIDASSNIGNAQRLWRAITWLPIMMLYSIDQMVSWPFRRDSFLACGWTVFHALNLMFAIGVLIVVGAIR